MDTPDITLKQCSRKDKCVNPDGSWLPATMDYFNRAKTTRLRTICKVCQSAQKREWYLNNQEHALRYAHDYRLNHLEECNERDRQYRINNPGKMLAKEHRRRDRWAEKARRYRRKYPEKVRAIERRRKKRRGTPAEKAYKQRRRAQRHNLPNAFTGVDWQYALGYFNGCCAICGRQLDDLFNTHQAHADHWIPLTAEQCPGTVPSNIIPLCGGQNGCNNRKGHRDPVEFLETEFGKRKAKVILAQIDAYFRTLM